MGIGGISIWQLLIILAIVLLLFGTKRLSSLGSDLGGAIKGFKKALKDDKAGDDKTDSHIKADANPDENLAQSTDEHKPKNETKQ